MTRHRVLHVIDSLAFGGAERQLLLNLSALDRTRFENFVCYLRPVADLLGPLSSLDVHVFCLGLRGKLQWPYGAYRLYRFMKQQRINIAHTSLFEADLLGGVAARLAGVPVITTLVNVPYSSVWLVDNPKLNTAKLAPVRWLRRLVLGACPAHNVAISNYVKQSSHKHLALAENKITVVRRAVSKEWMEPAPADLVNRLRVELHLNGAYPVLLNVGRLVPQKGQKYLIQGMPDVLRDFPKARLLIVGDGFLRPKLEQLRDSLGLGEQVHFLGNQIDVKALLQLCHIFVFPSIFEGLGVALLEAAALGRPCIASNVGPLPEIIQNGHSGLLVAPRSAEALAQAVIRLAGNEQESHAMGEGARETIVKRFLIDQTVKKLEAVYTEVLSAQT